MKSFLAFLLPLLCAVGSLSAQQVFVLFEPGCMTRVQYEQAIARQPKMDYFAYQITLSDGNKLILETGVEGNVRQNFLPTDYLRCNDPRITADLAEDINGNRSKVFMLIPDGNDYLIQPVSMAAILARQNNLVTYVSPLASFQFDLRNVIIGENLAYNNQNAKVFFEGRETTDCQGKYVLRQLMPRNAYPVIDYKLHPTLGILERRLGSDGETTIGGVAVVRYVNGQPVDNYLASLCGGTPTVASTAPATYGGSSTQPVVPYTPNMNVATAQPSAPAPQPYPVSTSAAQPTGQPVAEVTTHTVAKGETLWGLSKRYDVNVNQLREWNNMSGNTITVGQELRVSAPGMMTGNQAPPVMDTRNPVANNEVQPGTNPQQQSVPYYNPPSTTAATTAATPADREHIVQAGETVASIALKYGYTASKFREINGLGANEFIQIGQRLKTNSCNCPSAAPGASTAPSVATNPSSYGSGVVSPRSYNPQPSAAQVAGTPVGPTSGTTYNQYTPATNYNATGVSTYGNRVVQPQTANTSNTGGYYNDPATYNSGQPVERARFQQRETTPERNPDLSITNSPGFGQKGAVVPNRGTAGLSMNTLEGGNRVIGSQAQRDNRFGSPVTSSSGTAPATTRAFHMVQENESLYDIARRYNLTVYQLRAFNGLSDTDVIIPFQRLYIN